MNLLATVPAAQQLYSYSLSHNSNDIYVCMVSLFILCIITHIIHNDDKSLLSFIKISVMSASADKPVT